MLLLLDWMSVEVMGWIASLGVDDVQGHKVDAPSLGVDAGFLGVDVGRGQGADVAGWIFTDGVSVANFVNVLSFCQFVGQQNAHFPS